MKPDIKVVKLEHKCFKLLKKKKRTNSFQTIISAHASEQR